MEGLQRLLLRLRQIQILDRFAQRAWHEIKSVLFYLLAERLAKNLLLKLFSFSYFECLVSKRLGLCQSLVSILSLLFGESEVWWCTNWFLEINLSLERFLLCLFVVFELCTWNSKSLLSVWVHISLRSVPWILIGKRRGLDEYFGVHVNLIWIKLTLIVLFHLLRLLSSLKK